MHQNLIQVVMYTTYTLTMEDHMILLMMLQSQRITLTLPFLLPKYLRITSLGKIEILGYFMDEDGKQTVSKIFRPIVYFKFFLTCVFLLLFCPHWFVIYFSYQFHLTMQKKLLCWFQQISSMSVLGVPRSAGFDSGHLRGGGGWIDKDTNFKTHFLTQLHIPTILAPLPVFSLPPQKWREPLSTIEIIKNW